MIFKQRWVKGIPAGIPLVRYFRLDKFILKNKLSFIKSYKKHCE